MGIQSKPKATYSEHIRPLLASKCVSCHHERGQGPFPLRTYEQVRRRGDLVRLVALTGQMPPTDGRSDLGTFTRHLPLTPKELIDVQEWYRAGMPEGAPTHPIPAPNPRVTSNSPVFARAHVGKGMRFPAEGRSVRVVYQLPASLTSKPWQGFTFQPDAPKAVRQVVLAIQRKGQPIPFTSTGIRAGTQISAWSEGFNEWKGPAVAVAKGDKVWIQIRGVPTGKTELASGVASFWHGPPSVPVQSRRMGSKKFKIEAETQAVLHDEWVLERDVDLISVLPEARYSTEQVRLLAKTETQTKTVAVVLTWDAAWPGAYNFANPIRLTKGTTLVYEAFINNTRHGHAAEDDPPKTLTFGPSANDEVFWCHLTYIER